MDLRENFREAAQQRARTIPVPRVIRITATMQEIDFIDLLASSGA
jgi:hypothetical protein